MSSHAEDASKDTNTVRNPDTAPNADDSENASSVPRSMPDQQAAQENLQWTGNQRMNGSSEGRQRRLEHVGSPGYELSGGDRGEPVESEGLPSSLLFRRETSSTTSTYGGHENDGEGHDAPGGPAGDRAARNSSVFAQEAPIDTSPQPPAPRTPRPLTPEPKNADSDDRNSPK